MKTTRKFAIGCRALRGMLSLLIALPLLALLASGCASAQLSSVAVVQGALPKPDMIVINDFAVTAGEVKLDQGFAATAIRDAQGRQPKAEEVRVGRLVADKLAQALVKELNAAGIRAVRASAKLRPSQTTAILQGAFLSVDAGNQSARVWLGFGLGGSKLRTQLHILQGGRLVAKAQTTTNSGMKPGMLTSLGVAGVAGSVAPVVVGATATGVSEALLSTIEADASRTAKAVAKRIHKAYVKRGWMAR